MLPLVGIVTEAKEAMPAINSDKASIRQKAAATLVVVPSFELDMDTFLESLVPYGFRHMLLKFLSYLIPGFIRLLTRFTSL